ncbi:MAG: glycolate oxidase subunit GlcE [Limnohabitans sp.]|nr:glycolate oxidase subunit GlcE [Limnohabitans sp.]
MHASLQPSQSTDLFPDLPTLLDTIRSAAAQTAGERKTFRIHGSGSHDFYGESLEGELLETRGLKGIVQYEPSELVVTVAAGTPLHELETALSEQGQCLAFEPPHFQVNAGSKAHSHATVGGMVAAGLSGPARASAGAVRDFVLGLRFINGRGEHLTFGGQVMKNVAGYDVSRLLAGSWGTLGLITEVSLKVLPMAPAEAYLMCALPQTQALNLLHQWGGQPLPLNASCWVKDNTQAGAPEMLYVRLRGALAAVQAAKLRMSQDVAKLHSELIEQPTESAALDWALCRDQALPFFTENSTAKDMALWRLSVPQTAPVLNLPNSASVAFIEWHGAQRWIWAPLSEAQAIRQAAAKVGGQATLFRRPQQASAAVNVNTPIFAPLDTVQQRIQHALKNEFDPAGIFSPRRLNAYF